MDPIVPTNDPQLTSIPWVDIISSHSPLCENLLVGIEKDHLVGLNDSFNVPQDQGVVLLIISSTHCDKNDMALDDGEFVSIDHYQIPATCFKEPVMKATDKWEDDGRFMEDDCTNLHRDHSNDSRTRSTFNYNSDALIDTEEMHIATKCYAKDDNGTSFLDGFSSPFYIRSPRNYYKCLWSCFLLRGIIEREKILGGDFKGVWRGYSHGCSGEGSQVKFNNIGPVLCRHLEKCKRMTKCIFDSHCVFVLVEKT
ncbi:hypothetical protein MA16_Dca007441 [Dendrobium catenatum]|uniref:Uncharacterized protein n=1 Tax=Dendrobium catenatum TaxID=906689 RepID=A0A2I0WAN4_9ASPA|nr:hypothetical protein MA16_Dca007441 [Dendrobium catenatum]